MFHSVSSAFWSSSGTNAEFRSAIFRSHAFQSCREISAWDYQGQPLTAVAQIILQQFWHTKIWKEGFFAIWPKKRSSHTKTGWLIGSTAQRWGNRRTLEICTKIESSKKIFRATPFRFKNMVFINFCQLSINPLFSILSFYFVNYLSIIHFKSINVLVRLSMS